MTYIPTFKVIREDVGIYLFYAGKNRKFFEETRRSKALFLDLPGFTASKTTFEADSDIARQVHRARAVRRYLNNPTDNPRPQGASNYPTEIPTNGRRVDRTFLADVINSRILFQEIKKGDLVILTPGNHYDPVLLGEIATEWEPEDHLTIEEFREYTVPYRKVKWVQHDLARSDFAREVGRHMQNRRAVTQISEEYYENIFKLIYPRYIWGNISKLDIFSETYSSNDPTATYEASFLIKYAIALFVATEKGEEEKFLALDKAVAADLYFDPAIVDQMIQSFGSPGGYVGRFKGAVAAVFVAGVLAVALSDEIQDVSQVHDEVVTEASKQADDTQIDFTPYANSLRAGTDDELREKYGRQAQAKLGLTLEGTTPPEIRSREVHER